MEIETKKLIFINDLVRLSSNTKEKQVKRYVLQLSKKEKAIIVEQFQESKVFAVALKAKIDKTIKVDEMIPIFDSDDLHLILTKIVKSDTVELNIEDNKIVLLDNINSIELPYYEESVKDIEQREKIASSFTTKTKGKTKLKMYGDPDCRLEWYGIKDPDDPNPDSTCNIQLKRLNIANIVSVFNKGIFSIGVNEGAQTVLISVGGGKSKQPKNIVRTLEKENSEDPMEIIGDCKIELIDTGCLSMLAKYDGYTVLDMKKDFPLLIKKYFEEEQIGINYMMSLKIKEE